MRSLILTGLAALVLAVPATAQQGPPEAAAMQRCMDMMGGPPAALLLHQAEALGLSAEQVNRLEAIRDATDTSARMQAARAAHMRAAELLRADAPDLDDYEDALEDAAEEMVAAHVAMVRANLEAREVLTAEQRTRLGTLRPMEGMHRDTTGMPMRHMAPQGRGGDMQQMHQAMMMHCMMMGPMEH